MLYLINCLFVIYLIAKKNKQKNKKRSRLEAAGVFSGENCFKNAKKGKYSGWQLNWYKIVASNLFHSNRKRKSWSRKVSCGFYTRRSALIRAPRDRPKAHT